jgi:outer membrane lipoprotein
MHHLTPQTAILWLVTSLWLTACASQIPQTIREAPTDNLSLEQVRSGNADYKGRRVRWGGRILETENKENSTWLTLLAYPLNKEGKPKETDENVRRFIAIVPQFLDPKVYSQPRLLTVTGTIQGIETRKVGEFPYRYPIVQAEAYYLWPKPVVGPARAGYPYDPWYYNDPWFYDPRYPFGYPYRFR